MISKSPSGALSPYYYKGGYFHGIHFGSYFDNSSELIEMMNKERDFILKSPDRRRIMIDIYETNLTDEVITSLIDFLNSIFDRTFKMCISGSKSALFKIKHALKRANCPCLGRCAFYTDMEEGKTWLVGDKF